MAITDINISEQLETSAPSIKYTGNEGPQASPQHQQEIQIAQQIWEGMRPEQQARFQSFEQFFQSGIWKQILQQMQADQEQGQGIASLGPRNMEQMPTRMGAEYGGRIGYEDGLTVAEKGPLYIAPDTNMPLHNIEKKFQRMNKDERLKEYFEMLRKIEDYKEMDELDMKGHRFKDFLHWGHAGGNELTGGGSGWPEMTEALEYTDHPAAEELYETGEHFNKGGRTGIQSLRDGGRIGLYQGGGPHGDNKLSKIVKFLMSEFDMSEEQAIKQAINTPEEFKGLTKTQEFTQEPLRFPLRSPRSLLGMRPPPVEDRRDPQDLGISTLRGRP